MHSVSAGFLALQKKATNSGTKKRITVGATDVTDYLIRKGTSATSKVLEKELNQFISQAKTLTVSNHDDTFYNAGSTGLFDNLASEIALKVEEGLVGQADWVIVFEGIIDADTIQRIRDNVIRFTGRGYAKRLERIIWDGSNYQRRCLKWIVEQITDQIFGSIPPLDYDVDNLDVGSGVYGYSYLEGDEAASGTVTCTVFQSGGGTPTIGIVVNQGELWKAVIGATTGEVSTFTQLTTNIVGAQRLWYYNDYFWCANPNAIQKVHRSTGAYTDYTLTAGWTRWHLRFHKIGQYIYYIEELSGDCRIRRFNMATSAIDLTGATLANCTAEGCPIYDSTNGIVWVKVEDAASVMRWAQYDVSADTWDTSLAWPTGVNDPGDADDCAVKSSETRIYFPKRAWNYSTSAWASIVFTGTVSPLTKLKEQYATGKVHAWDANGEFVDLVMGATQKKTTIRDSNRVEIEPPSEYGADAFAGCVRDENNYLAPFLVKDQYIIPVVELVNFDVTSIRELLAEFAKVYLCTYRVTKDDIYFWGRNKYVDTFTLGKDLYAKAVEKQWLYWCDGLRLKKDDSTFENGSLTVGDRVLEFSCDWFPLYLGGTLATFLKDFYEHKRRLFEVDGVYLIQLELLDKPTLSFLSESVACFIYDIRQDPRSNITRLRLLEEV